MSTMLSSGNLIAIGLLLAMAAGISMNQRGRLAGLLALQFFLMSVYLSLGVVDYQSVHPVLSFVVARVSSMIPAVIWLIAFCLFRGRDSSVPVYMWYLFGFYVSIRALGVALLNLGILANSTPYYLVFIFVPQVIMLGLSAHSIYIAVSDFRADLIELRRKSRVVFVVSVALFIILTRIKTWIVYNGVVQGINHETIVTPLLDELITLYALIFSFGFFLMSFRTQPHLDNLFHGAGRAVPDAEPEKSSLSAADKLLIDRITRWMDLEKKYTQPGLTVVMFAHELGIHPHRLRRIINQHFGFDNFNQFLNHYRIKEAARALAGSSASVAEIAYEVGFSSISSFNAAFKLVYELTPTAYRRGHSEAVS